VAKGNVHINPKSPAAAGLKKLFDEILTSRNKDIPSRDWEPVHAYEKQRHELKITIKTDTPGAATRHNTH
jgi:hypothetical protein